MLQRNFPWTTIKTFTKSLLALHSGLDEAIFTQWYCYWTWVNSLKKNIKFVELLESYKWFRTACIWYVSSFLLLCTYIVWSHWVIATGFLVCCTLYIPFKFSSKLAWTVCTLAHFCASIVVRVIECMAWHCVHTLLVHWHDTSALLY